jgi:hypothetical protein
MAKKLYYLLDEFGRFFYITDQKREDIPELIEIETDVPLSEIQTAYHGPVNGEVVVIGQNQQDIDRNRRNESFSRLNELRSLLESTDYKVIKCYEAQLLSQPLPYDIQALSQERQAWRDEINEIQAEIASLQTGGAN